MTGPLHSPTWESDVEIPRPLYTPENLKEIAQTLGAENNPGMLSQLKQAAHHFWVNRHLQNGPRHSEKKAVIAKLQRRAKNLSEQIIAFYDELKLLDDASLLELQHHLPQRGDCDPFDEIQHLALRWTMDDHIVLKPFITALDKTLEYFPAGEKGAPPEWALHYFIVRLAYIYHKHTGKIPKISRRGGKQFSGPFFRFVLACLKPVAPEWCRDTAIQALGDHVKKGRNIYKKNYLTP